MERRGSEPRRGAGDKTHVSIVPVGGGKPLERDTTQTEEANLRALGYGVTKVKEPVFLKPRMPPQRSEEKRTADGEQWWQDD